MAHDIQSIAYVGERPWHGLGNALPPSAPMETWARCAGMEWRICESPATFKIEGLQEYGKYGGQKILYRSDTHAALSIVSTGYHVVQPSQVLEFFRDLVDLRGYRLESAGCLRGGRRFWALAKIGEVVDLPGKDFVEGYLLLTTSCDGTLATSVIPTSIRVVCSNTLHASLKGAVGGIRVVQSRAFDEARVKARLEDAHTQWDAYTQVMAKLARKNVSKAEAVQFFQLALGGVDAPDGGGSAKQREKAVEAIKRLYAGAGKGSLLRSANGTAWGLVNAVTEYVDYGRKTRSEDTRLTSAWFGRGALLKQWALEQAEAMLS